MIKLISGIILLLPAFLLIVIAVKVLIKSRPNDVKPFEFYYRQYQEQSEHNFSEN
jgi:hypothetical protein